MNKISAVIFIGENEKSGKLTLRNLKSGEEKSIEIRGLINEIKKNYLKIL